MSEQKTTRLTPSQRDHIRNIIKNIKGELRENKTVKAFEWVKDLEANLKDYGVLYD